MSWMCPGQESLSALGVLKSSLKSTFGLAGAGLLPMPLAGVLGAIGFLGVRGAGDVNTLESSL